jgi:sulfate/thiosulfate transport system ATP-binding protein
VWEHPASPFVYGFLGDVNFIPGTGYVRPHELALSRYDLDAQLDVGAMPSTAQGIGPSIVAQLQRALIVGPIARLELIPTQDPYRCAGQPSAAILEVQMPAEQFKALDLHTGETVLATPHRARAFEPSAA